MDVRLVTAPTAADTDEVWRQYDAVFGDRPDRAAWQADVWDRHVARDGFRLVLADGVGFGYGYTGEHGQWWTDHAAEVLTDEVARTWLGGHFELVSIGVLAGARGSGAGRRLLDALLDGVPHERLLLMATADADDPARRLYARGGWHVIGPGIGPDQVILGRQTLRSSSPVSTS